MVDFCKRLKELRDEKGLSQPQVAEGIKVSRSTYANWEQGRREPDIHGIKMLCEFFKVSAGYLIGLES